MMQNLLFSMSGSSVNSHTMTLGYYKDNKKYQRFCNHNVLSFLLPFFVFLRCFFMLFQATISLHHSIGQMFKTLSQALPIRWDILTAALKLNCLTTFLKFVPLQFLLYIQMRTVSSCHTYHSVLWSNRVVTVMYGEFISVHDIQHYFITLRKLLFHSSDMNAFNWGSQSVVCRPRGSVRLFFLFSYYKKKYSIEYF
jgi:hypothetical protein